MRKYVKYVRRGLRDTLEFYGLGDAKRVVASALVWVAVVVGFVLIGHEEQASESLIWLQSLAAVGATLFLPPLFLYSLHAPYAMECEAHGATRRELEAARSVEKDVTVLSAERDRLASQVQDLQTSLDYGFQVPVKLETLKQYAPSVAATQIEQWFDDLVSRAEEGDAHAKTQIPAVASALMNTMADWGASPARARATAKIEAAMKQLGLPWARPL